MPVGLDGLAKKVINKFMSEDLQGLQRRQLVYPDLPLTSFERDWSSFNSKQH
ncbi:MAG: hypothetical protein QXI39_04880 [Candidatus Bathyarchaeia archaeon]